MASQRIAACLGLRTAFLKAAETRAPCLGRGLSRSLLVEKKLRFSYWHEACSVPLSPDTLGTHIDSAAEKWGNRIGWSFVQEGKDCTFAQFREQVDQVARGLLSLGFCKGDNLVIWSPNTFNWVLMAAAMAKVGIVSASVHFALTAAEMERCLNTVDFKGIYIAEPFKAFNYYEILCSLIPELRHSKPGQLNSKKYPHLKSVIADGDQKAPGCISFGDLTQGGSADVKAVQDQVGMDDPLTIVFTSGTTGSPKAAVLSHYSFISNVVGFMHKAKLNEDMVVCIPLPFFHVYGLSIVLGRTLVPGVKAVVPSRSYDVAAILNAIQDHRCTDISGPPTAYADIISSPLLKQYDVSSLQRAESGGNVVTTALRKLIQDKLKVSVRVGYGTTELTTVTTLVTEDDPEVEQLHTVGRPMPHLEVKIADPATGREQPVNTPGELWSRGHNIFLGYYNDEQKTRECITEAGWYKTGDVAVMDEDGYVSIISRIKDVVIRGGENIFPVEIEEILNTHSAIQESLVIGVPDERMGEELCAWIVLKDGQSVTDEELKQHCVGKLTRFKIPKYFIYDANVPRTPIGKPQKAKMCPLAARKLGLTK